MKTRESTLVFDIGNSETDYGFFVNGKIVETGSSPNEELVKTRNITSLYRLGEAYPPNHIYIGSVNPSMNSLVNTICRKIFVKAPIVLGHPSGNVIRIKYKPLSSLGLDRIADALAGLKEYPLPLVVIDCGTAITFNIISSRDEFVGGAITVGMMTGFDSLISKGALLPDMELSTARKITLVGQTSKDCINSGFLHGFGSMIDGMVGKFHKQLRYSKLNVVGTGGMADFLKPHTKCLTTIDPNLTLKGYYYLGLSQES